MDDSSEVGHPADAELDAARRRARPVLLLVVAATLAIAASMGVYIGQWTPPALFIALFAPFLWLIHRGHAWARRLIAAACAALGLWGTVHGVGELVISFADVQSLLNFSASALLLVIAGSLHASEALRELGELRRNRGRADDWKSVSHAAVPADSTPIDPPERKAILRHARWGHLASISVLVTGGIAWLLFVASTVWLWQIGMEALTQAAHGMQSSRSGITGLIWLLAFLVIAGFVPVYLLLGYLTLFLTPFILSMPIALPLAMRWRQPARFLILRPFNRRALSRDLTRILRDEVAPLGHCYTLADADIRIPPLQRLPLLYGQLTFFTFRQRKIVTPRHLTALSAAMKQRLRRNINWAVSRNKLFPVASMDAAWQACVERMVGECHGVVMDLSGISENIRWELELLRDTGAVSKTVLLVGQAQVEVARTALTRIFGEPPSLVTYGPGGLDAPGTLTERLRFVLKRDTGNSASCV